MSGVPVPTCEMCQKPSAQLTFVMFDLSETYELCPACRRLQAAFEALTTTADRLFEAIGKQCGKEGVAYFKKKLAAFAGYEMEE